MRKRTLLLLFLATVHCCSAFAGHFTFSDETPLPAGENLPEKVIACLRWLHAGMTREQVEARLEMDGGLYLPDEQRYFVKGVMVHGKVVMIDLCWKPRRMLDEIYSDEDSRTKWLVEHRDSDRLGAKDVLKSVGKPYLSGVHID